MKEGLLLHHCKKHKTCAVGDLCSRSIKDGGKRCAKTTYNKLARPQGRGAKTANTALPLHARACPKTGDPP